MTTEQESGRRFRLPDTLMPNETYEQRAAIVRDHLNLPSEDTMREAFSRGDDPYAFAEDWLASVAANDAFAKMVRNALARRSET